VNTTVGFSITIQLSQLTAGPLSNVSLSFGDGFPSQIYSLMSSSINISYMYTYPGYYNISATATAYELSTVNVTVNNMTAYVAPPPTYEGLAINNINISSLVL
jgi:PKD repeat protein